MNAALSGHMHETVTALLAPGKGILAADESRPTIEKRFSALDIASTEENRRAYREMLFTMSGLGQWISGAILFDETIRQRTKTGIPMPSALATQGVTLGIKVDQGTVPLAAFAGEKITEGLDGLRERLTDYRERGARFTKWRAVFAIGEHMPTSTCIVLNARALALFAALSQEAGLVPIVEPELLMRGGHTIARCEEVVGRMLDGVFGALFDQRVVLESMLLKTGMVVSGAECSQQASAAVVAESTLRCLRRAVPAAVPGVLFLSGGQGAEDATRRLSAICDGADVPWTLSFSFGRALQASALAAWKGVPGSIPAAQEALRQSAQRNSAAIRGTCSARGRTG